MAKKAGEVNSNLAPNVEVTITDVWLVGFLSIIYWKNLFKS